MKCKLPWVRIPPSPIRYRILRSDISEIAEIESAEQEIEKKLDSVFKKIRLINNQKSILRENFLNLKESNKIGGEQSFNTKFKPIEGLGRKTKQVLISALIGLAGFNALILDCYANRNLEVFCKNA